MFRTLPLLGHVAVYYPDPTRRIAGQMDFVFLLSRTQNFTITLPSSKLQSPSGSVCKIIHILEHYFKHSSSTVTEKRLVPIAPILRPPSPNK